MSPGPADDGLPRKEPAPGAAAAAAVSRRWNTENLGLRLGADVLSAACAASTVAPVVTMIDQSIMENASGRRPLVASLRASLRTLLRRPHALVLSRPCALIFLLYGGTYLTANALDTAAATVAAQPATLVTSGTAKFVASSAANIALCIYKDAQFVRLFAAPAAAAAAAAAAVPPASYALFAARDCLTVFASFNVPPRLGPWLDGRGWAGGGGTVAQFVAPAAVQLCSTPLHLLGLDLYNRPVVRAGWRERGRAVARNWAVSTAARVCRIVPAFGVGGVVNAKVRRGLMERLV